MDLFSIMASPEAADELSIKDLTGYEIVAQLVAPGEWKLPLLDISIRVPADFTEGIAIEDLVADSDRLIRIWRAVGFMLSMGSTILPYEALSAPANGLPFNDALIPVKFTAADNVDLTLAAILGAGIFVQDGHRYFFSRSAYLQSMPRMFSNYRPNYRQWSSIVYVDSGEFHHPLRLPNPAQGSCVYKRYIPNLKKIFSLRMAKQEDFAMWASWMNNPRVSKFWGMANDEDKQAQYFAQILSDKHVYPLIGQFDGESFLYTEVYWAAEDNLSRHVPINPFDRGFHLLVGEEKFRGPHMVAAWLQSIQHFIFLDDVRTDKAMLEPRYDNAKLIGYLTGAGFHKDREFNFPHKRSAWMCITREEFYNNWKVGF
ncbi:hypothetical protein CANCADRAFT_43881 [Tortispora caseinolytica NRRL Y-17796]|uniref:Acyltransferase MbtK/IucB-like conserved domain-containing protein n=1 Tax=Tortispora caseinolytica NRRL Y-17796 TaxID=767744 RepID=A0A1E4TEM9_9ASCO|nr:hypothetical protein CANCADRAFT_43881 [Tortispora caseinolytica NRRL Y-17796]